MAENIEKKNVKENVMVTLPASGDSKGAVCVWNNVIAHIVKKYTLEEEGVIRLAPPSIIGGFTNLFSKKGYEENIVIDVNEENQLVITVAIVVQFGAIIPEVSRNIQNVIASTVAAQTGCTVAQVNVNIMDVDEEPVPEEDEEVAEEDEAAEEVK